MMQHYHRLKKEISIEKKKRWIMEYYERLWSIMKDYGVL
ncbi:UNVERIFIED_CONTAM: hypothetical protein NCL1_37778 [Trichonephila clavipes]